MIRRLKFTMLQAREVAIDAIKRDFADNELDYGRKLYLIENCLYGVDIQPIAIQITKLRCFISLVCDQRTNRNRDKELRNSPTAQPRDQIRCSQHFGSPAQAARTSAIGPGFFSDSSETRERSWKRCAIVTSRQQLDERNYHCRERIKISVKNWHLSYAKEYLTTIRFYEK